MAELLYRLGRFSARRAWLVITAWILILAATTTTMILAGGKLSTATSIPGTPAQNVIDDLKKSFPVASHGTASVVYHAKSGQFTDAQIAEIGARLKQASNIDGVNSVMNPFTLQAQKDHQIANLKKGRAKFVSGQQQIADGLQKIKDGQAKLDAAQFQVTTNMARAKAGLAQARAGFAQATAALAQAQAGEALRQNTATG